MTAWRHEDVTLGAGAHVRCRGKGRKERCTPLAKPTVAVLKHWIREPGREDSKTPFPSTRGGPLSADGVQHLLARHVACQQVLNTIGTQRSAAGAGKRRFRVFSAWLPNPMLQDRDRRLGQGSTTFLSSFSPATHMCAGSERDVLVPPRGHLTQRPLAKSFNRA